MSFPEKKFKDLDYDVVVIGAGIAGIYAVHKFRNELGLHVKAYERGSDIGGTWYWNRYPGACSDSEGFVYRYSFDKELLQEWTWKNRYVTRQETMDYLHHVVNRFDLRRSFQFNTNVTGAHFNEADNYWSITTDKGDTITAKFFITALGMVSTGNIPKFKGHESFKGEQYHTAKWPDGVDLKGKRVGVFGTGSSGVQLISNIAPEVSHLTVFQRTAQFVVPSGQRPLTEEEINNIKENYDKIWKQVQESAVGMGIEESTIPASSVSKEEQDCIFEKAWNEGGAFRLMFSTFCDITTDIEANRAASNFIKKKIKEIVKDPETARKLTPTNYYATRPPTEKNYYETFNRDNVLLVDVKATPVVEITPNGIRTTDSEYELDVIIYATGFDLITGTFDKIDIRGREGVLLREKWSDIPNAYLGMITADFPNMFMVLGPNGPFTNQPPTIETELNWITDTVKYMLTNNITTIEPSVDAEEEWLETCRSVIDMTLFKDVNTYINRGNMPGKKKTPMFYLGGIANFISILNQVGYEGFVFDRSKTKVE